MSRWLKGFAIAMVAALVGGITLTQLQGQSRKRSKATSRQQQTARLRPTESELKRLESFKEMVREGLVPVNRLGGGGDHTSRVAGDPDPDDVLSEFKNYASRVLNKIEPHPKGWWWADKGSKRRVRNEVRRIAVIRYIRDQEEPDLVWLSGEARTLSR